MGNLIRNGKSFTPFLRNNNVYPAQFDNSDLIFKDGKWYQADKFNVVLSATGAQYISIVDGNLEFSNSVTGFSINPLDTTQTFYLQIFFDTKTDAGGQSGTCDIGADAKQCIETGTGRRSWHDMFNLEVGQPHELYQTCTITNTGLFFAGGNLIITEIRAGFGSKITIKNWIN